MCTSCGHQPPESPSDEEAPERAFSNSNIRSLAGVVPEDASAAASATVSVDQPAPPAAAATAPLAEGSVEDGGLQVRHVSKTEETKMPPPLDTNEDPVVLGDLESPGALRKRKDSPSIPIDAKKAEERSKGGEEEGVGEGKGAGEEQAMPPKAFTSAPIHGMSTHPGTGSHDVGSSRREKVREGASLAENLASSDTTIVNKSNRPGACQADRGGTSSSASSTTTTDDAVEEEADLPDFQSLPERGVPPSVRADSEVPLPAAPVLSQGNAVSRAVQPPPRSTLRRRGGRRPFVPRHPSPSPPSVVASPSAAEGAEARLSGVRARTTSEVEEAKGGGGEGGEDEVAPTAVFLTPPSAEGADASSMALAKGQRSSAASRQRNSDRSASRNRGASKRQRQKRTGSYSSSSSPLSRSLSSKPATKPATGLLPGDNRISVNDGHPPTPTPTPDAANDDDDASGGCRVTFAAVPRESSPPPPPGRRVSGREFGGETHGPGQRTGSGRGGAKEMVHLAYCSRCQEYQSWRAPLRSAGCQRRRKDTASSSGGSGSPSARRNCTECGDLYSNVSYYPAR